MHISGRKRGPCSTKFIIAQDDFTLKGYYKHKESVDAPPPLTEAEQLLQEIKLSEVSEEINYH